MRNLDLTALRSFVAVADTGGVTRAAGYLSLTQSAVSMQLKRLEELLGARLLERQGRGVTLTTAGEQLLSVARRMLDLNDEALRRLSSAADMREISIGVPHDIVYPAMPVVMRQFAAAEPTMKLHLVSSLTLTLKERFAKGEMDAILTTEVGCDPGGETLTMLPLVWVGAPGGQAWRRRPLRLAFERNCIARRDVQQALDDAGIAWEMAVDSESYRTVGAVVSADLAVHAMLEGTSIDLVEHVPHGGSLPELQALNVNVYVRPGARDAVMESLLAMLRHAFGAGVRP